MKNNILQIIYWGQAQMKMIELFLKRLVAGYNWLLENIIIHHSQHPGNSDLDADTLEIERFLASYSPDRY